MVFQTVTCRKFSCVIDLRHKVWFVRGDLRKAVVQNKDRKIIGWYIYLGTRHAISEVVQIGPESHPANIFLDHPFCGVWKRGLIGLQCWNLN